MEIPNKVSAGVGGFPLDNNTVQVISSVAAAISAMCAAVTVYFTVKTRETEKMAKKPLFMHLGGTVLNGFGDDPDIAYLPCKFKNIGANSAEDVLATLHVFDINLQPIENDYKNSFSCANPIASQQEITWDFAIDLGYDERTYYSILQLEYIDPLYEKGYVQYFYWIWGTALDPRERVPIRDMTMVERVKLERAAGL